MLNANTSGVVTGKFTIPANILAGVKSVAALGANGSYGVGTFTGRGTITTEERRKVTTITSTWYDPLAQTFTLPDARHVAGIDLWFTVRGNTDVTVQIRDVVNGFPGGQVLAQKLLKPADLIVGGNSTRVLFDSPVFLNASVSYAIVILTDGADTALSVAEIGKYDVVQQKYITSQAYGPGVLLSSSNAQTWTAHQELDLAFRLLACKFTASTRTISLGAVTLANASDLLALVNIEIPATGASAELRVTTTAGDVYKMVPGQPTALPARLVGTVQVDLVLTGNERISPVMYPGVEFIEGNLQEATDYVTRSIPGGSNSRVSLTFEAYTPGTSSVVAQVQKADGTWQTLALTTGVQVGDGWVSRNYVLTGFTTPNTRFRLVLNSTPQYRAQVRKARGITTD